jgi:hypothetical protein
LTSTLDVICHLHVPAPAALTPAQPGTNEIGSWTDRRVGVDVSERREIFCRAAKRAQDRAVRSLITVPTSRPDITMSKSQAFWDMTSCRPFCHRNTSIAWQLGYKKKTLLFYNPQTIGVCIYYRVNLRLEGIILKWILK